MDPGTADRPAADGGGSEGRGRLGRAFELVLTVLASAVFVALWIYVALATFTDSSLPADTWAWLTGLELLPAIVVWIAILPIGVYLWALENVDGVLMAVVIAGLVAWTWIAWAGLARVLWRRAAAAG